jgi:nitric-oxide synthase
MTTPPTMTRNGDTASRDAELVRRAARDFFALPEIREITPPERWSAVDDEIARTGTYVQSTPELLVGAKLAWRNHARCAGRYSWRSLSLIDARAADTTDAIADACWEHLRRSTNGGKLRAVITVLPPSGPGRVGPRIHNPQLIRYAGYAGPDGVVGDPLHVALTRRCVAAGWQGAGTPFDVLPLLISANGERPTRYDVPPEAVLEVPITHPELAWFAELGLRWHANPAISCLCLEVGGIRYPAAPFSGWYVSSEIGARNFSDTDRYDMLPTVARRMGLDTRRDVTLWKDRALVELNRAVLWSYAQAGVHIIDHHTAAANFVRHCEREEQQGRQVPADWAWINPPLSASTTPTYHRTFDPVDFTLRPNFYPLDEAPGCPVVR